MALWQYDFTLIPEFGLIEHYGIVPDRIDDYFYDSDQPESNDSPNYWTQFDSEASFADDARSLLGILDSWTGEALTFGTEDGNKIEIWKEGDVNCRLDIRSPDLEVLETILRTTRKNRCLVLSHHSHRVLKPEMCVLLEDIRSSSAYRFCKDPKGLLSGTKPKE